MKIKEKFTQAKEKAKETKEKIEKKVDKIVSDHPVLSRVATGIGFLAVEFGAFLLLIQAVDNGIERSMCGTTEINDDPNSYKNMVEVGDGAFMKVSKYEADKIDYYKNLWDKEGKGDFDKVMAVAEELDMRDGDVYVIEAQKADDGSILRHVSQLRDWDS